MATPATKRLRVDPHALDDDTLPAKGVSVLGKRHRVQDNQYFYDNQSTQAVMRRDPNQNININQNESKDNDISMDGNGNGNGNSGFASMGSNNNNTNNQNTGLFGNSFNNNNMNQQSFMNNNNINNNNNNNGGFSGFGSGAWKNPPIKFTRGEWIDVRVTDTDDGESQWMCGVMTKDLDDKVEIHIPRQGIKVLDKTSQDLAPVGTHTEGFN